MAGEQEEGKDVMRSMRGHWAQYSSRNRAIAKRMKCGVSVERLEGRTLLSTSSEISGGMTALHIAESLSKQEPISQIYEEMQWNGQTVRAKRGEWIVKLNIDSARGSRSARSLISDLGISAVFKKTLGRQDTILVRLPEGVGYEECCKEVGMSPCKLK